MSRDRVKTEVSISGLRKAIDGLPATRVNLILSALGDELHSLLFPPRHVDREQPAPNGTSR